jgi:Atypical PilZ domain, cyclic di-GMP receptor
MSREIESAISVDRAAISAAQAEARLFSDAISIEGIMPTEFVVTHSAVAAKRSAIERSERVLRALRLFEEGSAEDADTSNTEPVLRRMDAKLNVLLDLVCDWMHASVTSPVERNLRFSRNGIRIDGACVDGFDVGVRGVVRVVLSERFAQAIEVPAIGIALEHSDNGLFRCWLEFDALGETLIMALERYLFHAHRRSVAVNRHRAANRADPIR